jgi:hypothetical protein
MATYDITDDRTGMQISLEGDGELTEESVQHAFSNARKQMTKSISDGSYKLDPETKLPLEKDKANEKLKKLSGYTMGLNPDEIDIHSGMDFWDRTKLNMQPTDADKMKQLEDTYGKDGVSMLDVGGTAKMFFRNPKTKKMTMVDEQGTSFADFTADIAGDVLPTLGSIVGGGLGLAGGVPGSIAGAALGGGLVRGAQDVATRALSGEDINLGEIAGRATKEAAIGGVFDVATLGAGKVLRPLLRSKLTGDASAEAFAKVAGDLPEGSLTPRMMQGEKALTRELGIESQVGGRVGDARQAIHSAAEREVGQVSTEAFERFSQKAVAERDELLKSVPAGDKKLAASIENQYQNQIKGFGAGSGRIMSDIGDEIIRDSVEPALVAARAKKNALYEDFKAQDAKAGGIFTAEKVASRFDSVIANNGMKNTKGIEGLQRKIAEDAALGVKYSLREIDDLISNVTDAMPDGVLKNRTAQQVAAELSDSLSSMVKGRAKDFPELETAWKNANAYYKDTYTTFGRGGIGGATKDASGETVLSGQGFMNSILSDDRQVKNLLSAAKEGGADPAVVKSRLKEGFLTSKGVHQNQSFTLSQSDRGVVRELWGERGLRRMESIQKELKGVKASSEDLQNYLGALSEKDAIAARVALKDNAAEAARLDKFESNSILRKMVAGDLPVNDPSTVAKAFMSATPSQRNDIMKRFADDPQALADLRSIMGADVLSTDLNNSGFKNAIGEQMFNGTAVLNKLSKNEGAYRAALGKDGYQKLVDLAKAQSRLAPMSKAEASAKLRTTVGAKGLSMFMVGDLIQSVKDKVVSLAYRTKSMDKLMSGWSKADPKAMKAALDAMLVGSRANRALIDMDDPEFEQDLRDIRSAMD